MRRAVPALSVLLFMAFTCRAADAPLDVRKGVQAFNAALAAATRRMDNAATIALWEENGISLLPHSPTLTGRVAIADFMNKVSLRYPGARMTSFEMACSGLESSGDWASEWCTEHQIVQMPAGAAPFDGRGKMLFVLHRGADGAWRLSREMWTEGEPP